MMTMCTQEPALLNNFSTTCTTHWSNSCGTPQSYPTATWRQLRTFKKRKSQFNCSARFSCESSTKTALPITLLLGTKQELKPPTSSSTFSIFSQEPASTSSTLKRRSLMLRPIKKEKRPKSILNSQTISFYWVTMWTWCFACWTWRIWCVSRVNQRDFSTFSTI